MRDPERKQEVLEVCLRTFMEKGLAHTSTRDLCDALHLNSGGVFYYFKTKDEIVIACAEEASLRIERDLIGVALQDIENPKKMLNDLRDRSNAMRPLMKFFVSVCASSKYEDVIQTALDGLTHRYNQYAEKFAEVLCCQVEEVAPYVYIGINAMLSYMLFGQKRFTAPQMTLLYDTLNEFLERKRAKLAADKEFAPRMTKPALDVKL